MRTSTIFFLMLLLAPCALTTGAAAQAQCQIEGFPAEWGIDSSGEFVIGSGGSCQISIPIGGQIQASNMLQRPSHGRLQQVDMATYVYISEGGFRGRDTFAIRMTGSGPTSSGTSTIRLTADVQ